MKLLNCDPQQFQSVFSMNPLNTDQDQPLWAEQPEVSLHQDPPFDHRLQNCHQLTYSWNQMVLWGQFDWKYFFVKENIWKHIPGFGRNIHLHCTDSTVPQCSESSLSDCGWAILDKWPKDSHNIVCQQQFDCSSFTDQSCYSVAATFSLFSNCTG